MSDGSIRLVIADDHPVFRRGMRALLGTVPDLAVVGEAESGADAVRLCAELAPDVVLMDLQMPGGSGIEATLEIRQVSPVSRVLVITLFEDDDSVFAALRAGALGYILKDTDEETMVRAIRAVAPW